MKLEEVCIQLCQGGVSVGCTDKPCIVDSVPDHMVVVAFQKLAAFIPVVVQEPVFSYTSLHTEDTNDPTHNDQCREVIQQQQHINDSSSFLHPSFYPAWYS